MKWKTKDGRILELSEMSDKHIQNARRLVANKITELDKNIHAAYVMTAMFDSDGAAMDSADSSIMNMEDESVRLSIVLKELNEEITKREAAPN